MTCDHDDVGGCRACERALRAEVAALREDLRRAGEQQAFHYERGNAAERELAEARALLARLLDAHKHSDRPVHDDVRDFLRRDEARGANQTGDTTKNVGDEAPPKDGLFQCQVCGWWGHVHSINCKLGPRG